MYATHTRFVLKVLDTMSEDGTIPDTFKIII